MQTARDYVKDLNDEERALLFRRISVASRIRLVHDFDTFASLDMISAYKTYIEQQFKEGDNDANIADKVVSLSGHKCSSVCGTRPIVD